MTATDAPPDASPRDENPDQGPERAENPDFQPFLDNWLKIAERSRQLVTEFLENNAQGAAAGYFDPVMVQKAFLDLTNRMMRDPERLVESQIALWQDYMRLWQGMAVRMMGGEAAPVIEPDPGDKRFADREWTENQLFDFIKQSYLLTARWARELARGGDDDDADAARKAEFLVRQFVDAMSPSNFALTNPEVLRATIETQGENLVKGLENLLRDLERGKGMIAVRQTDMEAFEVGRNVATTPGKVIFRNDLIELIQYAPVTETVYARPLLIIPPWINKFYILDLKEKNSFVRWLVSQGYTVFMISWVNPDERYRDTRFDDYMLQGPIAAMNAVEQATSIRDINVVGYCVGGTLLAATLAWLTARGEAERVKSATFLVTQVDFADAGELRCFIDEDQLRMMERMMAEKGYLDAAAMAATFNSLRANDLVWSFVVNNYLLGRDPFPFDLLYWNSDSTRVPKACHEFYLREMYLHNNLAKPGALILEGVPIDLSAIKTPVYIQAAETDHICPYDSVYKATQIYSGPRRFVLAGSGHIAGVVNPPAANKYHYWTNEALPPTAAEWREGATKHPGSWWPDWHRWQAKRAGRKIPARDPAAGGLAPLCDAPGAYVRIRS